MAVINKILRCTIKAFDMLKPRCKVEMSVLSKSITHHQ